MARILGLPAASLLLLLAGGCSSQMAQQFEDGLAAIGGKGGTIARSDNLEETAKAAARLAATQPAAAWEAAFPEDSPDFIEFIDERRVLIGTVEVGAYLGVPSFKQVALYDSASGKKLWQAERPDLARGQYTLVTTQPAVVLFGANAGTTVLMALERDSGSQRWRRDLASPVSYVVPAQGNRMALLSAEPAALRITGLDLGSGAAAWERTLSRRSAQSNPRLVTDEQDIYVLDGSLGKLRAADGAVAWSADLPEAADDAGMLAPLAEGLLVWNASSMALVDRASGKVLWRSRARDGGIKIVAPQPGRVYRVVTPDLKQIASAPSASDTVESIDIASGALRWSRGIEGTVVSGLAVGPDAVAFTVEEAVCALRVSDGERTFCTALVPAFRQNSPTEFNPHGQPDLVLLRGDTLYVSRESAGVAAFSLPGGQARWVQGNDANPYSRPARHGMLSASLSSIGVAMPATPAFAPSYSSPKPSIQLQAHQYRMNQLERMHTDALKRRDFKAASTVSGLKADELQGRIGQMQAQMRQERMEANLALAQSLVSGLPSAVEGALKATAQQGMVSRLLLELESSNQLQRAVFQGRYHVRPFREPLHRKARGVTVVDLDTGKRADLAFSPTVEAMLAYGVDLPHVAISPGGDRLIAVGVGLRSERYEPYVKFKVRMPRPSVLAYDIASLRFVERNAEIDALMRPDQAPTEPFAQLVAAARAGNVLKVRRLLDRGVDPNPKQRTRFAPLILAAENGFVEVVSLLVARGANVNYSIGGRSAVDFAKDPAVRKLLLDAGARPAAGK